MARRLSQVARVESAHLSSRRPTCPHHTNTQLVVRDTHAPLPFSLSLSLSLSLSPRPGVQHTDGRRPTVVRASGQSDLRTAGAAASLSLTANLDAEGGERLAVAEPWTITGR
ncbi:hypothetical protein CDEST_08460 [Colletotrichum destructivum]|uniref:Uncharacterized protein n=1 Tax=Colletotrichum destructivum TaxID=34406 RepID=A0AAX4IJY3_9PEZI|nr:hypothetical protein CDEST_08460 [Colletotrichum destructivum]